MNDARQIDRNVCADYAVYLRDMIGRGDLVADGRVKSADKRDLRGTRDFVWMNGWLCAISNACWVVAIANSYSNRHFCVKFITFFPRREHCQTENRGWKNFAQG